MSAPVDVLAVMSDAACDFLHEHDDAEASERMRLAHAAVAELIETLRPFADLAELFDEGNRGGNMPRADTDPVMEWPRMNKDYGFTVGDLRNARAALARCTGGSQ